MVNDEGVHADGAEGQAEIGLELARKLGWQNIARQFRCVVRDSNTGELVFAKGVLVVNPYIGAVLKLRTSNVKLRRPDDGTVKCSFNFTDLDSSTAHREPRLNSQLLLALQMRCLTDETGKASEQLASYTRRACVRKFAKVREEAWGLPFAGCDESVKLQADEWVERRTPHHKIRVCMPEADSEIDDEQTWSQTIIEREPWAASHGTRESLLRGRYRAVGMVRKLNRKPQGAFDKFCGTGIAISDFTALLTDRQCYIIKNGKPYVGSVMVWRHPVMTSGDVQLWQAVPLPEGCRDFPDNCVVCTRKGSGISSLSGGDYDGDIIHYATDDELLELLRTTCDCTATAELQALRSHVREALLSGSAPTPLIASRAEDYNNYILTVETPQLRAFTVANAERALQHFFEARGSEEIEKARRFYVGMAEIAYAAFDAPKKFGSSTVRKLCVDTMRFHELSLRSERASVNAKGLLGPIRSEVTSQNAFSLFNLDTDYQSLNMGRIWLSKEHAKLGKAAGKKVRQLLLHGVDRMEPAAHRSIERQPIREMAGFLAHRMGGASEATIIIKYCLRLCILRKLNKSRGSRCKTISSFLRTCVL